VLVISVMLWPLCVYLNVVFCAIVLWMRVWACVCVCLRLIVDVLFIVDEHRSNARTKLAPTSACNSTTW
jgi:hypothetical protein